MGKTLVLHVKDPGSISNIEYDSQSISKKYLMSENSLVISEDLKI